MKKPKYRSKDGRTHKSQDSPHRQWSRLKAVDKMSRNRTTPLDHPLLSPCGLCAFGALINRIKGNVCRNADGVKVFVCSLWNDVNLEEVQLVFHGWMTCLERVSEPDGEYGLE
jgi:hypothetical protein